MARWQFMDKKGVPIDAEIFDDGGQALPGEDGFSVDAAKAEANGRLFNYVGPSAPPEPEPAPEEPQP